MDAPFDRQERIAGWSQPALAAATGLVLGADPACEFAVWALGSMGLGCVVWLGAEEELLSPLGRLLLRRADDAGDSLVALGLPESAAEWAWADGMAGPADGVLAGGGPPPPAHMFRNLDAGGVLALSGGAAQAPSPSCAASLARGALGADWLRASVHRLAGDPEERPVVLDLPFGPAHGAPQRILQVGCGGIGVYTATLAAMQGHALCILDPDRVETSNLNRQGLFDEADVRQARPKAEAAASRLRGLFPGADVHARVVRFEAATAGLIEDVRPTCILSAVDNAASRLCIQNAAIERGLPVIQGGTDVFAADCFVQQPGGPTLDEQCHGMLSRLAAASPARGSGGCGGAASYVVPGMMCAAMMMERLARLGEGRRGLSPLRWRRGCVPMEGRERRHATVG